MTDLVPAPLVSRQAAHYAPPPPNGLMSRPVSEIEARANMLAAAGPEMLPKNVAGKPGAAMLYLDFADRYDLPIVEVLAEVSFNRGRASIGARLQRKMAGRRGVQTVKVEGDDKSCTVAALGPDGIELGRATYTYETAKALGIIYNNGQSGALKQTWAGDPAQMLYHRATTRVLDHYGPTEYAGLFVADQDHIVEHDALAVLASAPGLARTPEELIDQELSDGLADGMAEAADADDEPTDAEVVDALDTAASREVALLAYAKTMGLTSPKVSTLRQAAEIAKHAGLPVPSTLAQLCDPAADQLYQAVVDWIENREGQ